LILTLVSHDDVAYSAKSLEPAPSAVETAANKQHYDDNDQKSCGVHIVLLLGDKRGPLRVFLKTKRGQSTMAGVEALARGEEYQKYAEEAWERAEYASTDADKAA